MTIARNRQQCKNYVSILIIIYSQDKHSPHQTRQWRRAPRSSSRGPRGRMRRVSTRRLRGRKEGADRRRLCRPPWKNLLIMRRKYNQSVANYNHLHADKITTEILHTYSSQYLRILRYEIVIELNTLSEPLMSRNAISSVAIHVRSSESSRRNLIFQISFNSFISFANIAFSNAQFFFARMSGPKLPKKSEQYKSCVLNSAPAWLAEQEFEC